MTYAVLDNIIIIICTVIGSFTSRHPSAFIIAAGLLMVLMAYQSFDEKSNAFRSASEIFLMTLFAVLSGGLAGFLVFALLQDFREYVRLIMGAGIFIAAAMISDNELSLAMCIMKSLFLITMFILIMSIYHIIYAAEKRKILENKRVAAANISEMHEKRLNEQLVLQNFLAEKNARLVERETISRNIHNSVGHSITAAIMTLDAADVLYDVQPEAARKKMNDAAERICGSLEAIRRAVRVLDEDREDISPSDLKTEMHEIINAFETDTGRRVDKSLGQLDGDVKIPHDHAVFLTGALQEMLTNGVKHGKADWFIVVLTGDTAHIRLEVSDNGRSDFDAANSLRRIQDGFGIKKMVSYVEKCGGKAEFVNDNGFKGTVELPIVSERGQNV